MKPSDETPPQAKTSWASVSSKNLAAAGQQALFGCCYSLCKRSPSLRDQASSMAALPKGMDWLPANLISMLLFCF